MQKRIGVINEQLNRVVRIIQDLLSSTRQRKPEPTWYPAERLIEPVVALIEPAYHAKGVMLQAVEAPPVLVWADAEKIHQVLGQSIDQRSGCHRGGRTCDGDCRDPCRPR